jgi:streptogramin lyase
MAFDGSGNLYVTNAFAHQIDKIAPDGTLNPFATVPDAEGLAFDARGNLYVSAGDQIQKVTPAGTVSLFATLPSGSSAFGLAFDAKGNLYAADALTDKISKINALGVESTFATLPTNTFPTGLAFDGSGNLYVTDVNSPSGVHKITPAGAVSVFTVSAEESFLYIAVTDDAGHPLALPPATPLGDYNGDGIVNAAD